MIPVGTHHYTTVGSCFFGMHAKFSCKFEILSGRLFLCDAFSRVTVP